MTTAMQWPWRSKVEVAARESAAPAPVHESAPPAPEPQTEDGWWFAPAGLAPRPHESRSEPVDPSPGVAGLYAAGTVLDALPNARSTHLCRVRLGGMISRRGAMLTASERIVLWCFDPSPLLRSIATELAREVLATPPPALEVVARRPLRANELDALRAQASRARDALVEAEQRADDAQWRLERLARASGLDWVAKEKATLVEDDVRHRALEASRDARISIARAKSTVTALDALVIAAGRAPAELGASIELGLRALAWHRLASSGDVTADALDRTVDAVRGEWAAVLDARVLAIAEALGVTRQVAPDVPPEVERLAPPPTRDETDDAAIVTPDDIASARKLAPTTDALLEWGGGVERAPERPSMWCSIPLARPARDVPTTNRPTSAGAIALGEHERAEHLRDSPSPTAAERAQQALWRTRWERDEEEEAPRRSPTSAVCPRCAALYAIEATSSLAVAVCACGQVGMVAVDDDEPRSILESPQPVACSRCTRFSLRMHDTEHLFCPHCHHIAAPVIP